MGSKETSKSNVSAEQERALEQKCIAIVGVGLIGGSLALQLREKKIASRLIGVDSNKQHGQKALELKLVDELLSLDEAIAQSEVIYLAIPGDHMLDLLPIILGKVEKQIVRG